jgi:hypothetical protein
MFGRERDGVRERSLEQSRGGLRCEFGNDLFRFDERGSCEDLRCGVRGNTRLDNTGAGQ